MSEASGADAAPSPPAPPEPRPYRLPAFLGASIAVHLGAVGMVAALPARWPLALGLLIGNHLAIGGAGLLPRTRLLGPTVTRLGAGARRRGEVALTFDDGPDPVVTPAVLDLLDAHGARASFFLIGRRVEAYPEIAREIVRRGHEVENHTHRHRHDFSLRGPRALASEIVAASAAIERATGRRPHWFRAPAGLRGPFLEPVLARSGLALAAWTRRGFDAVSRDPDRVLARLLRGLGAGDVLLLHDGSMVRRTPRQAERPVVLDVLPRLLTALAARGLLAVPMPPPGRETA